MTKIFGIGLSRTGTTSLTTALEILGFSAIHLPTTMEQIDACDAATDTPVAATFRLLDTKYPGSRFIYTTRDREPWLKSCEWLWVRNSDYFKQSVFLRKVHIWLYGSGQFDRSGFMAAYDRHQNDVLGYFAERPDDLLVLDICGGAGWDKLCFFLNLPVPKVPFPWTNKSSELD